MDQINVLSMAQAVTEKQPNPSAAGNSQTQSSSFREMLADRQKAVDDSGEKTSPAEKLEEQSSGKSTVVSFYHSITHDNCILYHSALFYDDTAKKN